MRLGGHQENRLNFLAKLPVGEGHLKFVIKVRGGPKPPDDTPRPFLFGIFYGQAVKAFDVDAFHLTDGSFHQFHPLFESEKGFFLGILGHPDKHFIKDQEGPPNQVDVAVGHGVKRSRINGPAFGFGFGT